ncbi:ATP-binding cassette domain-containing protein [Lapidilactobacillus achengensis]|uniref:ATP-binding cassette domain-containing protein n=1 Tax=Lapidilactobacillus achengensis TaxID=2486000 RepID=A0ABW1UM73_9LACO|nr:ATP-binding cassette domain-containing protein [Lapidilactobacillus achengensis]
MIEVKQISKAIKGQPILDRISVNFEAGYIYGLRGKNGAGKTMLLRAIAGLINIDTGKIIINDQTLHDEIDFPPSLGILIENDNLLPEHTAMRNLQLLARIKKVASDTDIETAIRRVGLDPADQRIVKKFSLGMRQRLAIAQAIFERPDLILLDEPTNAIDTDGVEQVREILLAEKKRGATIVIASHSQEDLAVLADVVYEMAEGHLQ